MPRFRMLVLCALVACLALPASASAMERVERVMIDKVNDYRAKHGLPKLRASKSLSASADRYSWKQMRGGYFGHAGSIQASSKYRRLGEILEWHSGLAARPSLAFKSWLNSGGHRAVIIDRGFRYVGAGRASGRFRGRKATIWTMHFGAR
jgi:uncharacterized protein YkwD